MFRDFFPSSPPTSTATLATNAFLTEINPDGTALVYSALFGGKASDIGNGVAVDAAGDAFVVGSTTSTNFPTTNTVRFSARDQFRRQIR